MTLAAKKLEHPVSNDSYFDAIQAAEAALKQRIRGKDQIIELSLAALLAGGHVLLEGPPGTGKTALAHGLAMAVGGDFKRIQMTSDMLPSDVVGFLRIKPGTSEFEFRKGPVFDAPAPFAFSGRCAGAPQAALAAGGPSAVEVRRHPRSHASTSDRR